MKIIVAMFRLWLALLRGFPALIRGMAIMRNRDRAERRRKRDASR